MDALKIASAAAARAAIARQVLGDETGDRLGEITLLSHQHEAVRRLRRLIGAHGGALLADDVGLGKTYAALAIAAGYRAPMVVAPAAVRVSWIDSARRAGVAITFASVERLSVSGVPAPAPDFVIIDEAHHLRTPGTKRFIAASMLCQDRPVLLLSASPVQNRLADLRQILSLFLGERAHAMPADSLAQYLLRRDAADLDPGSSVGLPALEPPRWLPTIHDVDCLDRILALPSPLPPADGDDGGVLLTFTLVRQWASSRAALRGALLRRIARGMAMCDALRSGRLPSRRELASWSLADDTQQLSLPELTVRRVAPNAALVLEHVLRHLAALRHLRGWLETSPDPDHERALAIRELMRQRRGERVIAFSEFRETVAALFRRLVPDGRVAMLTHRGGQVTGGPLPRQVLLDRFRAGAGERLHERDRVDLLLTTDVLSEGVNLPDARVVLHLDLAWNPARLEQRVGRLRRLDSTHPSVGVYLLAPPAPAERLLGLQRRLQAKRSVAADVVGVAGHILPDLAAAPAAQSTVRREERIAALLRTWPRCPAVTTPVVAATWSKHDGAVACIRRDGIVSLLAITTAEISDDRGSVERLLEGASGPDAPLDGIEVAATVAAVRRWLRSREVSDVIDLPALRFGQSRRSVLRRVDAIARRAARQSRPGLAPLMHAARRAATATLPAGAERVLDELVQAPMSDQAWLQALGEFATLHARPGVRAGTDILALLFLRPARLLAEDG